MLQSYRLTMRFHVCTLLILLLSVRLSSGILPPASKRVKKDSSSPPARQCTFDTVKYNISQSWYPLLLPYGYFSCIKCVCEMSKDGAKVVCKKKECKEINCSQKHVNDGTCCKTCPDSNSSNNTVDSKNENNPCMYNGRKYTHGTIWKSADHNGVNDSSLCTECSCSDGFVSCAIRICPKPICRHPIKIQNSCCKLCHSNVSKLYSNNNTGCNSLGRRYQENEQWYPLLSSYKPKCIVCVCKNSRIHCSKVLCDKTKCNKQCCKQCKDSKAQATKPPNITRKTRPLDRRRVRYPDCFSGSHHKHNTTWSPVVADFSLACVICKCLFSRVNCSRIVCPHKYPCKNPVEKFGVCCKQCNGQAPIKVKLHRLGWKTKRSCGSGNTWRVYEYIPANQTYNSVKSADEIRGHFILESMIKDKVEVHTFRANRTYKDVRVKEMYKSDLQRWKRMSSPLMTLREIGVIREGRRQKLEERQRKKCTNNCLHIVRSFIKMVRIRSRWCRSIPSSPPSSLLSLKEGYR